MIREPRVGYDAVFFSALGPPRFCFSFPVAWVVVEDVDIVAHDDVLERTVAPYDCLAAHQFGTALVQIEYVLSQPLRVRIFANPLQHTIGIALAAE